MSLFSKIASAEHTFAAWAEKELTKLHSAAPTIEKVADTVLSYVGPALSTVVTATAGTAAGSIVASVIQEAQSDLTAASGLIYDFGATPSVASVLGAVGSNLASLLTAGHVTAAGSVSVIQKVVGELTALVSAMAPAPAAAPAAS